MYNDTNLPKLKWDTGVQSAYYMFAHSLKNKYI